MYYQSERKEIKERRGKERGDGKADEGNELRGSRELAVEEGEE